MQETSVFHSETFPPTQRVGEERVGRISKKTVTKNHLWANLGGKWWNAWSIIASFCIMFVFFFESFWNIQFLRFEEPPYLSLDDILLPSQHLALGIL